MSRFNKAAIYKVFLLFLSGVLAISGVSALVLPAAAQTGQQSVLSTCTLLYAVQPGDTLASISKTFNTTDVSIMGMNAFLSQPGSANGNTSGSTSTGSTSAVTGTNTTTATGTTSSTAGSNAQNSANVRLILGVVLCLSNDANVGLPVTGASGQNNGSSNSSTSGATGSTTSTVTSTATTTGTNSASTGQNNQAGAGGYAACTLLYAVQKGDTLANIAKKFNATDATITEANINAMNPFLGNNANGSNNSNSSSNANNNNALMPGLVLCLSNTSGVALPNTGSTSGSSSQ